MRAQRVWIIAALVSMAGHAIGQTTDARLFRVSASNDVGTLSIDADGLVSWSNHPTGEMVRVEAVYDSDGSNEWATYTHIISDDSTGTVQAFDRRTPDGFSFVPAGTFVMGSPEDELGRRDDETLHQVTLTQGFYVQKTEVTNRQMVDVLNWARGRGLISAGPSSPWNQEGYRRPLLAPVLGPFQILWDGSQLVVDAGKEDYPCSEVTWSGAQAYCNYLSDMEGLDRAVSFTDWSVNRTANGYRLPTEAEWEYACRAGTTTAFCSGGISSEPGIAVDSNLDQVGWYNRNANGTTHPVGLKQANAWDLYDMHGNVWEWCEDWYTPSYPGTVTDPAGPASGTNKVRRGGSWFWSHNAENCRSASRSNGSNGGTNDNMHGFRPARTAMP